MKYLEEKGKSVSQLRYKLSIGSVRQQHNGKDAASIRNNYDVKDLRVIIENDKTLSGKLKKIAGKQDAKLGNHLGYFNEDNIFEVFQNNTKIRAIKEKTDRVMSVPRFFEMQQYDQTDIMKKTQYANAREAELRIMKKTNTKSQDADDSLTLSEMDTLMEMVKDAACKSRFQIFALKHGLIKKEDAAQTRA